MFIREIEEIIDRLKEAADSSEQQYQNFLNLFQVLLTAESEEFVVLKSLRPLIKFMDCDAAFGCIFNPTRQKLEVAAAEQVSASFINNLDKIINEDDQIVEILNSTTNIIQEWNFVSSPMSIVRQSSIVTQNSLYVFLKESGFYKAIVVPLFYEQQLVGAIVFLDMAKDHITVQLKKEQISFLKTAIDLTAYAIELKISESSRKKQKIEAEKMLIAKTLASGVAHNFNNILQIIMGQASLLKLQVAYNSPLYNIAQKVVEASAQGADLISQLLNFASVTSSKKRLININGIIKKESEFYKSLMDGSVRIEYQFDPNLPEIMADNEQIKSVIFNLVTNAKESAEQGEKLVVKIDTELVEVEDSLDLEAGEYVKISVSDNGSGMSAETKKRCFEPFYSTKGADPKTGVGAQRLGLGLSVVYSIIKQHGGLVSFEDAQTGGTIFNVFLPIAR